MQRQPDGYYYLHENGDLIYKRLKPDPSDFVKKVWPIYLDARDSAWLLLIKALALGANRERVNELAAKWGIDDEDAQEFVKHATHTDGTPAFRLSAMATSGMQRSTISRISRKAKLDSEIQLWMPSPSSQSRDFFASFIRRQHDACINVNNTEPGATGANRGCGLRLHPGM